MIKTVNNKYIFTILTTSKHQENNVKELWQC